MCVTTRRAVILGPPFILCLQVSQDAEDLHTSRLQIVAMSGTMQNVDELRQWLGAEVYLTDCRWASHIAQVAEGLIYHAGRLGAEECIIDCRW